MPAFLAPIVTWFTTKFGAVIGSILAWLLNKVWAVLYQKILEMIANWKREKDQEQKTKELEEDRKNKEIRDDETRKKEDDWLNS